MIYVLVSALAYGFGIVLSKLAMSIGFSFSPLVVVLVGLMVVWSLRGK